MPERYAFDPPEDVSLKDMVDLFRTFLVEVDGPAYRQAPENVKRMFRPSILGPSPSRMYN